MLDRGVEVWKAKEIKRKFGGNFETYGGMCGQKLPELPVERAEINKAT